MLPTTVVFRLSSWASEDENAHIHHLQHVDPRGGIFIRRSLGNQCPGDQPTHSPWKGKKERKKEKSVKR
jgi:hypothetical protein